MLSVLSTAPQKKKSTHYITVEYLCASPLIGWSGVLAFYREYRFWVGVFAVERSRHLVAVAEYEVGEFLPPSLKILLVLALFDDLPVPK
jgi:hypothetical protein